MTPTGKNVEALQTQVDQVKAALDVLKNETNEALKKAKIEEAAVKVKATKEAITKEIVALKWRTDTTSIENKAKFEKMFATLETLETSNTDLAALKTEVNRNWIQRQRDGVTSKEERKANTWANILRVAWWIGVVALAWKWIKSLFGIGKEKNDEKDDDKKEEKTEKKPRWKKALLWWWWLLGWTLVRKNWDKIKEFLWLWNALSFEDSLIQAEAELWNISESDEINHGRITYEESNKQIKSYNGVWTAIDKWGWFSAKKIEWLDIKFSDYKQLIHAANLTNYIKQKYTWRCKSDTPFYTNTLTWDIYIKIKDGDGKEKEQEIISGGIFSTLAKICPDVLNWIFTDTKNKEKFLAYLNKQGLWKEWTIEPPDPKGDKIQKTMNDVRKEINDTPTDFDPIGKERGQIITVPGNAEKTEYTIQSRWNRKQETKIKMEADSEGNIISWKIDGVNVTFTTVKELLRTANLVNKLKYQYHVVTPLLLWPNEKAFYRTSSFGVVWWHPWIYVDNATVWTLDDRVIKKETLESVFPTVLINKEVVIAYINGLKDETGKWLWEK